MKVHIIYPILNYIILQIKCSIIYNDALNNFCNVKTYLYNIIYINLYIYIIFELINKIIMKNTHVINNKVIYSKRFYYVR